MQNSAIQCTKRSGDNTLCAEGIHETTQRHVTLCWYIFINKFPIFVTLSHQIDFTMANHLENRKILTIFKAFKDIYNYYLQHRFRIVKIHMDHKFAPLGPYLNDMPRGPWLNIASANEQVPEVEWPIWVIKKRTQAIIHSLPYPQLPKTMIIHVILKKYTTAFTLLQSGKMIHEQHYSFFNLMQKEVNQCTSTVVHCWCPWRPRHDVSQHT